MTFGCITKNETRASEAAQEVVEWWRFLYQTSDTYGLCEFLRRNLRGMLYSVTPVIVWGLGRRLKSLSPGVFFCGGVTLCIIRYRCTTETEAASSYPAESG